MTSDNADRGRPTFTMVLLTLVNVAAIISAPAVERFAIGSGQTGWAGRAYPWFTVGVILAASLLIVHETRAGRRVGCGTWLMLALGPGVHRLGSRSTGSSDMTSHRPVPRWPLFLIASPAAVAVWSGWVGLGAMAGFGMVAPLPGIVSGFRLDTAITLPVGVEAYCIYAMAAWLSWPVPERARKFARRSAIGALCLGMLGQVAFHVLSAEHARRAPWPVVVLVACMPVITLGFGAALTHLLRVGDMQPEGVSQTHLPGAAGMHHSGALTAQPVTALGVHSGASPEGAPPALGSAVVAALPAAPVSRTRTAVVNRNRNRKPVTDAAAEVHFTADLSAGQVPSVRRIQRELHVGQDRAQALRQHMASLAAANPRRSE